MKWSPEASSLVAAAPSLIRWTIRKKIEALALEQGVSLITPDFVLTAKREHQPMAEKEPDITPFFAREEGDPMTDAFAATNDVHIFAEGQTLPPDQALRAWLEAERTGPLTDRSRCLYVHVPFCRSRCVFCPFYSNRWKPGVSRIYADALVAEIECLGGMPLGRAPFAAVYFGGGTPSDLAPRDLRRVLRAIRSCLPLSRDAEVTLEGRVWGQGDELLATAIEGGVNRFSVGVQTFDTSLRRSLGRKASREEVTAFLGKLSELPAAVVIDLMFGLPGQSLQDWQEDLRWLTAETRLAGVDLYRLKTMPGSVMEKMIGGGRMPPTASLPESAAMFAAGVDFMSRGGWERISLSHWRRDARERSRYNALVKSGADCIPVGCGAGGRVNQTRFFQTHDLGAYLEAVRQGRKPIVSAIRLGSMALVVDRIAAEVEQGRLEPLAWVPPETSSGGALQRLLEQWTRAGLLAPLGGSALGLTLAGQFWSLQMGLRLTRLVQAIPCTSGC